MQFRIKIKPSAVKDLDKLPRRDQERIKASFIGLSHNPFAGKKLLGEFQGFDTIRVFPYRIIYYISKKEVLVYIVDIGHRQGVYN